MASCLYGPLHLAHARNYGNEIGFSTQFPAPFLVLTVDFLKDNFLSITRFEQHELGHDSV